MDCFKRNLYFIVESIYYRKDEKVVGSERKYSDITYN